MKKRDIIPLKKEFFFLFKIILLSLICAAFALLVLYFFLNKDIEGSYTGALGLIKQAFSQLNLYIYIAVFFQLTFSLFTVYFVVLWYSHKIAGPMFRLKMILNQFTDEHEMGRVKFRENDFLQGVSNIFTDFFSTLNKRKDLITKTQKLTRHLEKKTAEERQELIKSIKNNIRELES